MYDLIPIGNVGLTVFVLGIILLLCSIIPSSVKADLRNVGTIVAILGLVVYVVLILFG